MGRAANPVDTTLGGPDDLLEGVASEVGQLAALALEVTPQRLGRVELRGIAGQPLHHQPAALAGDPGLHEVAAVGRQPVPQQGRLLPTQEAPQLAQHADQAVGVVAAGLDMEGQLAAATGRAKAQRGGDRGALPVEPVDQHGGVPAGRPGRAHDRGQRNAGLVEEADDGLAPPGVFLILGQSLATHWRIACSLRSWARRAGRCRLQSRRWRSSRHTCAGWWRTPVRRQMTMAMRSRVHRSVSKPWALAPFSRACSACSRWASDTWGVRPGAPRLCRPAVPSACQRWCQRLTVWRETPRVRATSAWWTSWANSSAACRRRSWNAWRSRRSAVGLRRVAIGSCSYHDSSVSPYTAKLFRSGP